MNREKNEAEFEKNKNLKQYSMMGVPEVCGLQINDAEYFRKLVLPTLLVSLDNLVKERPPNPVEFLAYSLIKNKQ